MHDILPIFVTDGGEAYYDVLGLGAKMKRQTPREYGRKVQGTRQPAYFVSHSQLHDSFRPKGRLFLSNDHAATYAIAMAAARNVGIGTKGREKLCMIVFDAHIDLYWTSRQEPLNKANDFRALDEQGLLERIIFVGAKASEELILRKHGRKVGKFNRKFAEGWRQNGTFAGIRAKVDVIPADEINSFEEGLQKALALAKGCRNICIDVDLDVFSGLEGVDYNSRFPERLLEFVDERVAFARKKGIAVDWEKVREIRDYAKFARAQIAEKGLQMRMDCEKISRAIGKIKKDVLFFHVTEYDQGQDKDSKAAKLAAQLLSAGA